MDTPYACEAIGVLQDRHVRDAILDAWPAYLLPAPDINIIAETLDGIPRMPSLPSFYDDNEPRWKDPFVDCFSVAQRNLAVPAEAVRAYDKITNPRAKAMVDYVIAASTENAERLAALSTLATEGIHPMDPRAADRLRKIGAPLPAVASADSAASYKASLRLGIVDAMKTKEQLSRRDAVGARQMYGLIVGSYLYARHPEHARPVRGPTPYERRYPLARPTRPRPEETERPGSAAARRRNAVFSGLVEREKNAQKAQKAQKRSKGKGQAA